MGWVIKAAIYALAFGTRDAQILGSDLGQAGALRKLPSLTNADIGDLPLALFALDGYYPDPAGFDMGRAFLPTRISITRRANPILSLTKGGYTAIPFLLSHLNDPTKTKIVIQYSPPIDSRYDANKWPKLSRPGSLTQTNYIDTLGNDYHLTVGDLCFFALGQIVNRQFDPLSSIKHLNHEYFLGPSAVPSLAGMAQREWKDTTARKLLRSLSIDLLHPDRLWRDVGAVRRLKAFFPRKLIALAAKRVVAPIYDGKDAEPIVAENDWLPRRDSMTSDQYSCFVLCLSDVPSSRLDAIIYGQLHALAKQKDMTERDDIRALAMISRIGYSRHLGYTALCIQVCRRRLTDSLWKKSYQLAIAALNSNKPLKTLSFGRDRFHPSTPSVLTAASSRLQGRLKRKGGKRFIISPHNRKVMTNIGPKMGQNQDSSLFPR